LELVALVVLEARDQRQLSLGMRLLAHTRLVHTDLVAAAVVAVVTRQELVALVVLEVAALVRVTQRQR
jgi:hypothetical protein